MTIPFDSAVAGKAFACDRISALEEQLEGLEKRRGNLRSRRAKDGVQTVAIVGYTNAGKSTLMNTLTEAGVLAEDKLFATLDPTSRGLDLPDGRRVMLIDTVGLIRRLPHHLVEAFKSTLEEAASATVILNVCDASSDECAEHLRVTADLLRAGKIRICRGCKDCLREMALYCWDERGGRDTPRKEHDHAMDEMRYFAMNLKQKESGGFAAVSVERTCG